MTGFNSSVSPELLIIIKTSFLDILPRSPCEHSLALIEKGMTVKNRLNCKYCKFYKTEHCT